MVDRWREETADAIRDLRDQVAALESRLALIQSGQPIRLAMTIDDPTSGDLTTVQAPDGGILTFTYDGPLLTQRAWSGTVSGTVSQDHNNDLNVVSRSVNGAHRVGFQYDQDGLLAQAGNLTLERHPDHGLVTGTTLGSVTTSRTA